MYEISNPEWKALLLFRDYLKENWKVAEKYGRLKLKSWRENRGNREQYTTAKSSFVEEILEQAKGE